MFWLYVLGFFVLLFAFCWWFERRHRVDGNRLRRGVIKSEGRAGMFGSDRGESGGTGGTGGGSF